MICSSEDGFGYFNPCGCQLQWFDPTNLLSKLPFATIDALNCVIVVPFMVTRFVL